MVIDNVGSPCDLLLVTWPPSEMVGLGGAGVGGGGGLAEGQAASGQITLIHGNVFT